MLNTAPYKPCRWESHLTISNHGSLVHHWDTIIYVQDKSYVRDIRDFTNNVFPNTNEICVWWRQLPRRMKAAFSFHSPPVFSPFARIVHNSVAFWAQVSCDRKGEICDRRILQWRFSSNGCINCFISEKMTKYHHVQSWKAGGKIVLHALYCYYSLFTLFLLSRMFASSTLLPSSVKYPSLHTILIGSWWI